MDSRENPVEDMMVDDTHAPKQCIFSNDREWPTQPTLLVGGLHTFPIEGDLCHLCDSIVKIVFNIEGGPTPIKIMKMRFMCVRAHKHKGTFSFNTASGPAAIDDAGLQIDREQLGKPIEDQNSVLKNYLLKCNAFLQKKDEALDGNADSVAWLEDKANKVLKFNGGGNERDLLQVPDDMDAVDGSTTVHLKHFMQTVFTFLMPVTKMFFQSLIESLMAEFNHVM